MYQAIVIDDEKWVVKSLIELNRCAMACEGCGAVFSLT